MRHSHFRRWLGAALVLGGCSALTIKGGVGFGDEAKAKQFLPEAGLARVYVFRGASFMGKELVAKLVVNKKVVAENGSNQFTVMSLAAGAYDLECMSGHNANALAALVHNAKKTPLHFTAEPGKVYYLQQIFKGKEGFSLEPISPQQAQPVIKTCKLAATVRL